MAPPKRKGGGRVTPKGTKPGGSTSSPLTRITDDADDVHHSTVSSSRYTPPVPKYAKVSPRWVPVLMFTLLALGVVVIIFNYLGWVPGDTSNWYLLVGLGLILGGIIVATQYH